MIAISNRDKLDLSSKIKKLNPENIFADDDFFNWGASILKGDDGKYHMFYSRWDKAYGMEGWLARSEIAHAVSSSPCGPYEYKNTILSFNKEKYSAKEPVTAHNPKIKKFNGKYYLYYISTKLPYEISAEELKKVVLEGSTHRVWKTLRRNQRTFAISNDKLETDWVHKTSPLLEPSPPIHNIVVNPGICQGPDNLYYLIVKGDELDIENQLKSGSRKRIQAIAISKYPDREFKLQNQPALKDFDSEDASVWYDKNFEHFYAVFHSTSAYGQIIGLISSRDGKNWQLADNFKIMNKELFFNDGSKIPTKRIERPFIFTEKGDYKLMTLGVLGSRQSFIAIIPLQ